jgi:predicted acylesterase/phospholipase RssA
VIHAYLAADRPAPLVVAGISVGAITAAAMQRAYSELLKVADSGGVREARRWAWFRNYLTTLTRRPFAFLWDAIPDQSDFFTNRPPVRDTSPPPTDDADTAVRLRAQEAESRQARFLLTKLSNWIGGLRLKVSEVAEAAVRYVRFKERYGGWTPWLALRALRASIRIFKTIAVHVALSPAWVIESQFLEDKNLARGDDTAQMSKLPRPLFGHLTWFAALLYSLSRVILFAALLLLMVVMIPPAWWPHPVPPGVYVFGRSSWTWIAVFLLGVVPQVIVILWFARVAPIVRAFDWLLGTALENVDIHNSFIHPYALSRELHRLFGDALVNNDDTEPRLLIVAAPLQILFQKLKKGETGRQPRPQIAAQLWPEKAPLARALRAAMSIPVLLPPVPVAASDATQWISRDTQEADLDIIDGASIRENPIPAMFTFFRRSTAGRAIARRLETASAHDARIHVVYSVPSEANANPAPLKDDDLNIVTIAQLSRRLARRRDTGLEIDQANFISRIERVAPKSNTDDDRASIFADAIAPERDITFANTLSPTRDEMLAVIAEGCRQTLERLYNGTTAVPLTGGSVPCETLIRALAPERAGIAGSDTFPGLPEVCGKCTRNLNLSRVTAPPPPPVIDSDSPLITCDQQRIVLITSGGVFRGAFHIGMIAALRAANVKPDLIVGASVGTLMGAAFGRMFDPSDPHGSQRILAELVDLFVCVDKKVALTRTLKSAARELGIRGRKIDLSPHELRSLVRGGTRADPGYAAIGAPPVLVDAISDLFIIPYAKTREIAARFVAGDVSGATDSFLTALKEHTLSGLDVERFVIGTALLEPALRKLLGLTDSLSSPRQPFRDFGIDFYATATDIGKESSVLLGEGGLTSDRTFSFAKAALASSAFPAVFSTVPASEILPGAGRDDVHYGDGGMFDNLPFFPAIRLLTAAQLEQKRRGMWTDSMAKFRSRFENPDLLLVGALNVNPEEDVRANRRYKTILQVASRAPALKENVKIREFEKAARIVDSQMRRILSDEKATVRADFLDRVVSAAILSVFPSSPEHLNRTFAFCASTGLVKERVHRSIADGCFRTFGSLTTPNSDSDLTGKALRGLRAKRRVPEVIRQSGEKEAPSRKSGLCPFYVVDGNPIRCPFFEVAETALYLTCRRDPAHRLTPNVSP